MPRKPTPVTEENRCQGVKADGKRCEARGDNLGRDVYGKIWRLCGTHFQTARRAYEVVGVND